MSLLFYSRDDRIYSMRNERNGSKTVKVTYNIGADVVAGIERVARDLHISVGDAARKLLAAGMMVEAAEFSRI